MVAVGDIVAYYDVNMATYDGIVVKVISSTVIDVLAVTNPVPWADGDPITVLSKLFTSVSFGTSANNWNAWNPSTNGSSFAGLRGGDGAAVAIGRDDVVMAAEITARIAGDAARLALPTVSTPTRVLGTVFTPSSTRPTLCIYSGRVSSTQTLTGTAGRIEALCDANTTPTTIRGRMGGGATGGLAVTIGLPVINDGVVVLVSNPNDKILLRGVNETGTCTFTLTNQVEVTL